MKFGGVIRDGEAVERIVSDGDIVTLTTSKSTYKAHNVVVTAGPWTAQLTEPLGLRLPLEVRVHTPFRFVQLLTQLSRASFSGRGGGVYKKIHPIRSPFIMIAKIAVNCNCEKHKS